MDENIKAKSTKSCLHLKKYFYCSEIIIKSKYSDKVNFKESSHFKSIMIQELFDICVAICNEQQTCGQYRRYKMWLNDNYV